VHERAEELVDRPRSPMMRSRPPSPVKEESSSHGHEDEPMPVTPARTSYERSEIRGSSVTPPDSTSKPSATPKKRRTSLAPSERSVKTISAGKGVGSAHPGVIRLYSTFNDKMSLCKSPSSLRGNR
jgi:3-phosphoinositide dependent protein kinase-1